MLLNPDSSQKKMMAFWSMIRIAWKLSEYGGFSGPYITVFFPNTEKHGLEKFPHSDIFHAVSCFFIIKIVLKNSQNLLVTLLKRNSSKDTFLWILQKFLEQLFLFIKETIESLGNLEQNSNIIDIWWIYC